MISFTSITQIPQKLVTNNNLIFNGAQNSGIVLKALDKDTVSFSGLSQKKVDVENSRLTEVVKMSLKSNEYVRNALEAIIKTNSEELKHILSIENKAEAREKLISVGWFSNDQAKNLFDKVIFNCISDKIDNVFTEECKGHLDKFTEKKQRLALTKSLADIANNCKILSQIERQKLNVEESIGIRDKNKLNPEELIPIMYEQLGNYAQSMTGRNNEDTNFAKYKQFVSDQIKHFSKFHTLD